ncbi:predicted protein [Nematostella vectensis]|uniref:Uncharacterized protein n=1 Tax=Nematostella vectensis TaxID=45351 RepID=A7SSK1_NEMVE|nr:predicted protein [Nematostella vectensis]|eukprot:XP_001625413.1 predicted protein [Nematostella vectensis]
MQNILQLAQVVCGPRREFYDWLLTLNFLHTLYCGMCGINMELKERATHIDGYQWKCPRCLIRRSLRTNSFFELFPKTPLSKLVVLIYFWSVEVLQVQASTMLGMTPQMVGKVCRALRLLCSRDVVDRPVYPFGGPNHVCKCDETVISFKRKYGRGRISRQRWVFGLVTTAFQPCRGTVRKVLDQCASFYVEDEAMRKAKCTSLRTIFLSEKDLNFNCVPRGSRLKQAEREGRVQTLDLATNHSSEDVLSILKSKFPTLRNELELPKRLQFLQPGAQGNNGWNVSFYGVPTGQEIYNAFNRTKRMYFCLRTKAKKGKMIFKDIANGKAAFQALSTPIKKKESSKVLSINPPEKGKKPDKPSKVHLRGSPSSSPSSGDDLVPVLEYKEVKEKSELNALSNPGKGKSTDPSKVHDRDPSPSSSDEYNQPSGYGECPH